MAVDPKRVQQVFLAAAEQAGAEERAAILDRLCEGDAHLRTRVETLLRAHDAPGAYLESFFTNLDGSAPAANTEGPGSVVGPYKLLERIGEGGFGVVFMAEQLQPVRRKVALKVLKPGMDTRQVVARFEAERQALALMDHPNIARVLDGGAAPSGRPYFVMELVKGSPITAFCDHGQLSTRERLDLFLSVCRAVQHAHQKGVIHRDLKPSNVLVSMHDTMPVVKVIDFGVAKALGQELTDKTLFTGFAQLIGTPLYMSPEQSEGSSLDIDTRSDIYSLGVLLYELLTGTTPFVKERFQRAAYDEVCRIIRDEEPPKPSTRLSESKDSLPSISALRKTEPAKLKKLVRGELDWIVMKALEKDRNRRYETANGLAADVQRYLNDEAVQACPPSMGYRARKLVRRNKGPFLAASLLALTLVGGIIGTTWGLIRTSAERAVAVNEANQKRTALKAAQASERKAKDMLWLSLYERARSGRSSQRMGQRLDSLDAVAQAARLRPDGRLRDEAIAAMALPDIRRAPGWRSSLAAPVAVAFGSHYQIYARVDKPGNISVRSIPDDREIARIASGAILGSYLHFSPDNRFLLALESEYALRVWRVSDGRPALADDLRNCRAHAFSPNGQRLAVGQNEWAICYDLATGKETHRWRLPLPAHTMAFHHDNEQLAVGYFRASVSSVYQVSTGNLVAHLLIGSMENQVVAWHPHGDCLAIAGSDPRIQLWNVAKKRKTATLEGHLEYVETVTFHPDGNLVASHSWDGALRFWDPATGRCLLQTPLTGGVRPRFSADGRWLAAEFRGDRAELLEVTSSREYRTLAVSETAGNRHYNFGGFSPDGSLLAVGMDPGARLWDVRSGREIAALPAMTVFAFFDVKEGRSPSDHALSSDWSFFTCGSRGLERWPVASDPLGDHLRLGPPAQVSPLRRIWFTRHSSGRPLAALTDEVQINQIVDIETGGVQRDLGMHPQGEVRALSADGAWAASCGWHSDRVRLWDARSGKMVHEWTVGPQTHVYFTPDSRTLIISRGDEYRFIDVQTQRTIRRLARDVEPFPGYIAFSPDGALMALEMSPAVIHLKETSTCRTVARLADPHGHRATWLAFSPDGGQLAVVARTTNAIHLWDLRAIRVGLAKLNLDWDWPAFAPRTEASLDSRVVTVDVGPREPGDSAATRAQRSQEAIERGRLEVSANPESAVACNRLAWNYLMAPEPLRDAVAAVPLAEKAAKLEPANPDALNTLGVAYYRVGRYAEAAEVLERNLDRLNDRALAHDLLFLAMCRQKLGDAAKAREAYAQAVRWVEAQGQPALENHEELLSFLDEARELLGIEGE